MTPLSQCLTIRPKRERVKKIGHKSIGTKLKRVKTYQAQQRALTEWSRSWQEDQEETVEKIEKAAAIGDCDDVLRLLNQIKGITSKRFDALNNMIDLVCDPERVLIDRIDQIDEPERKPVAIPEYERRYEPKIKGADSLEIEEMVKRYKQGTAINLISDTANTSVGKVIKILVTEGVYSSETYDTIKELRMDGIPESEIAKICGLGKSAMDMYTPYTKGVYSSDNPTDNALRIRKSREKS